MGAKGLAEKYLMRLTLKINLKETSQYMKGFLRTNDKRDIER